MDPKKSATFGAIWTWSTAMDITGQVWLAAGRPASAPLPATSPGSGRASRRVQGAMLAGLVLFFVPVATAKAERPDVELAFMPRTMTVTLLNEGGKYVAIDLKRIDQGQTCRMDKDAIIMRVGPGSGSGTIRVRYVAPQLSSGGCPFLTEFDLASVDYAAARKAFEDKKDAAEKRVDELKKGLREKWDEVLGQKN